MRISILCSSLAPMRDGVGDYTRALAAECMRQGHACQMLALNDAHTPAGTVLKEANSIRLSSSLSWARKEELLAQSCLDFQPDILSWQIVPYGYSPKGILPLPLLRLAGKLPVKQHHVMLHELWIGVSTQSRAKERLVGWLQRRRLLFLLRRVRPVSLHTSNPSYQSLLSAVGISSKLLPLFGNIPISLPEDRPENLPPPLKIADRRVSALLFGTVHRQWTTASFVEWLHTTAQRKNTQALVIAAGRLGSHGQSKLDELRTAGIDVQVLGEQPASAISALMQTVSFGVALHPWALIGKSGVVAAMLDHGLPVLVPRDDWTARGLAGNGYFTPSPSPLLLKLKDASPEQTDAWLAARQHAHISLPTIVRQFIQDISIAGT